MQSGWTLGDLVAAVPQEALKRSIKKVISLASKLALN